MSPFLASFVATLILILFGDGVCAAVTLNKSKSQASGWIVIALGWGLAVCMSAAAAPTGDNNPALTIAYAIAGKGAATSIEVLLRVVGAMLGGIIGGVLVWLVYLPHWSVTEDKAAKLGVFCTAPAIRNYGCNFLTEAIATAALAFMILAVGNKAFAGLGYFNGTVVVTALGLSLGGPTGYAINPARDLGPRIAHAILPISGKGGSDWSYSWIPVLGPIVGAIVGTFLFVALGI